MATPLPQNPQDNKKTITRRRALTLGGAVLGLGALCQEPVLAATSPVENFLAQKHFVIAHRGAGDVNPEHTAYAYQQAILKGAQAVEISVRTTSDNVMVCIHDNDLGRTTTGKTGRISQITYAELKEQSVEMRSYLGSGTPLQPIPTLDEALNTIAKTEKGGDYSSVGSNAILFIEAKDAKTRETLLAALTKRKLQDRVVIKIHRNGIGGFDPNTGFNAEAKAAGFKTWCYFDVQDSFDDIKAMAASNTVDMLGYPFYEKVVGRTAGSATDQQISSLVALGKPVIVWEVHRRSVMEKLKALGVRGFMSPDPFWLAGRVMSPTLALETARRQHGMLPAGTQLPANMPVWEGNSLIHQQSADDSILLGPLSHRIATSGGSWALNFSLRWKDKLPELQWQHGYLAFGRQDDAPFGLGKKFDLENPAGGAYVLAFRPQTVVTTEKGQKVRPDTVQLLKFSPGSSSPVALATLKPAKAFAPNQEIACKIIVRPESIVVEAAGTRSDPIYDTSYRGAFVHFGRYHSLETGGPLALNKVSIYKI